MSTYLLLLRLRMSAVIPPLCLYAFMGCVVTTLPCAFQFEPSMQLQVFVKIYTEGAKKCIHILRDVIYVKCIYIFWHPLYIYICTVYTHTHTHTHTHIYIYIYRGCQKMYAYFKICYLCRMCIHLFWHPLYIHTH